MDSPQYIWLQWVGDAKYVEDDTDIDPGDVTWCQDKIFKHDVKYVRVDNDDD